MTTAYKITATQRTPDGTRVWADTAEVLGDAYGRTYATEAEAQEVAARYQSEVSDYDLDPTTTYEVEEVEIDDETD